MHIADGFIGQPACVITTGLAAASLAWAARSVQKTVSSDQMKLAPIVAATVFAGQMVNFALGTEMSGHFVGSALAAILLGPALGILVMSAVIAAQCAFLGDGGVAALGANILSMGVVGVLATDFVWKRLKTNQPKWAAAGIASWVSVLVGSAACAAVVSSSGIALDVLANHSLIGLLEAGITVVTLLALQSAATTGAKTIRLAVATVVFLSASPLTSTLPDGLEAALSGSSGVNHALAAVLVCLPLILLASRMNLFPKSGVTKLVRVRR